MRRRRWLWLALAALAAAAIALALDPARQTRWLVDRARDDYGIALKLSGPARLRFFPSPSLKLEGVRATIPGENAPLLEARSIAIELPWRALWSSAPSVKSLTIDAPTIDLRRVSAWRASRAAAETGPPAPPRWPTLETPLHVRGAHWVLTDEWALEDFDLDLGAFGPGARLQLAGRGALVTSGDRSDISLEASALAREASDDGIGLDEIELAIETRAGGKRVRYSLTGSAVGTPGSWSCDGRVTAIGADATTDFAFELAAEESGAATLSLDGELAGSPLAAKLELASTRGDPVAAIARGLQGKLTVPKLRVGDVEIEGLQVEAEGKR